MSIKRHKVSVMGNGELFVYIDNELAYTGAVATSKCELALDHAAEVSRLEARVGELSDKTFEQAQSLMQYREQAASLRAQLAATNQALASALAMLPVRREHYATAQLTAQPDGVAFVAYSTDERGFPHMELDAQGRGRLLCIQPTTATQGITVHGALAAPAAATPPEGKALACPNCGAHEVEAYTPMTVYACGSKDYDQRPNTFKKSTACLAAPAPACKTCGGKREVQTGRAAPEESGHMVYEMMECPDCNPAGEERNGKL